MKTEVNVFAGRQKLILLENFYAVWTIVSKTLLKPVKVIIRNTRAVSFNLGTDV